MRKKIGECLVQAGLITRDDLRRAIAEHKRSGERLGVVLVRMNMATEEQIANALAFQLGFPYLDLERDPPDPEAAALIHEDVARRCACIGVRRDGNVLTVAMADPLLFSLVQDLEAQTGYRVKQAVATRSHILEAICAQFFESPLAQAAPARDRRDAASGNRGSTTGEVSKDTLASLANLVVMNAIKSDASEVHVEPTERGVIVRHRVDGVLSESMALPRWVHEELIARLKIMSGMDVAEKLLAQEGRIRLRTGGTSLDLRLSTLRTVHGEKIVIRALEPRKDVPALADIGLSASALAEVRQLFRHERGLVLVAGPPGSGRTTTLSAVTASMKLERSNVVTVEDPVEYQIPGVTQSEVNVNINQTFASAFRSALDQNPDAVFVGEIRDGETAAAVVDAASARLVLSTVRGDDAEAAVARLIELAAKPDAVASVLVGVITQRLVRRLCTQCRVEYTPAHDAAYGAGETARFYRAIGCAQCGHMGYRGRIGVFEVMRTTDSLRRVIASGTASDGFRQAAAAAGMVTLAEDALAKVKSGVTTLEELQRVVDDVGDARALCPACGAAVGADFEACARCGERLGESCPHCRRALQPGWRFCPYCARSTEHAVPARRRDIMTGQNRSW